MALLQPTTEQLSIGYWIRWLVFLAIMSVLASIIQKRVFKLGS